jgi:alkaline phosphatase isozyme conversion protein
MKRILPLFLLFALIAGACAPLSLIPENVTEVPATHFPAVGPDQPNGPITQVPAAGSTSDFGQIARQHLEALTRIGGRWSGSSQEAEAGKYIVHAFESMGYSTERQAFTDTGDDGDSVTSSNIIAVKDGESSQVIVVGAHYDAVEDGKGTDDNGSGVAVLLEAAQRVANQPTPYTIDFVAFGAEEAGLLGSYAFVSSLSAGDISDIVLFVNLDSISAGDIAYVYGPEKNAAARDWTMNWANAQGYDLQTIRNVDLTDEGDPTADYGAFDEAGIPWIYFEATNWTLGDQDGYTQVDPQYGDEGSIIHTQYDDLAYLDRTFPGRVDQHLNLFVNVLYNLLLQYKAHS